MVKFWDALDVIGVELYLPLVINASKYPDYRLPYAVMESNFGLLLDYFLINWYQASGLQQKMLITEFGYPSSNYGMKASWVMA